MRRISLALACASLTSLAFAAAMPAPVPGPAMLSKAAVANGCIAEGGGTLRARLRGVLDLDLDWSNAEMLCDGGPRPDGSGLRVSIAGPDRGGGKRLRFVFGISGVQEGSAARARPTNLTLVVDGEQRIFSTRGDSRCVTDELQQQRLGTPGGSERRWRVQARGFCLGPAATYTQDARILVSRFDFTAQVLFRDEHDPVRDKLSPRPETAPRATEPVRPR